MLKRIRVKDVRLGMFIHDFVGSWMDHPFWRNRFLLDDPEDLRRLQASAVREVWIDTALGVDVSADVAATGDSAEGDDAPSTGITEKLEPSGVPTTGSRDAELRRAYRVLQGARDAVADMFRDVRMGRAIDHQVMQAVALEITDSVTRNGGALISLARLKSADDYTYLHSVAVCALMVALARQLGLSEEQTRSAGFAISSGIPAPGSNGPRACGSAG